MVVDGEPLEEEAVGLVRREDDSDITTEIVFAGMVEDEEEEPTTAELEAETSVKEGLFGDEEASAVELEPPVIDEGEGDVGGGGGADNDGDGDGGLAILMFEMVNWGDALPLSPNNTSI